MNSQTHEPRAFLAWRPGLLLNLSILAAFALPLVAVLAPLGLAPCLVAMGAVAFIQSKGRVLTELPAWTWPVAFVFPAIAVASALWSIDPKQSLSLGFKLAGMALAGLALCGSARGIDADARKKIGWALLAGFVLGVVLCAVEFLSGTAITKFIQGNVRRYAVPSSFNRGVAILSLLVWCAMLQIPLKRARSWVLAAFVAVIGAVMLTTTVLAAKVAIVLGAGFLLLGLRAIWPAAMAARAIMVALIVALPFALQSLPSPQAVWQAAPWLPSSAHHRLTIWRFTSDHVIQKPWLGWGGESSRSLPGAEEALIVYAADGRWFKETLLPLHPHNAVMQVWLEFGAVGAVALIAIVLALVDRITRIEEPKVRAVFLSFLVGTFVVASVSFGAWQSWWVSALWLLIAGHVALVRR